MRPFVSLSFRRSAAAQGLIELLGFDFLLELLADEHGEQADKHRRAQQQARQPARYGEPAAPQAGGKDVTKLEAAITEGAKAIAEMIG